jgi:hypothetical protein
MNGDEKPAGHDDDLAFFIEFGRTIISPWFKLVLMEIRGNFKDNLAASGPCQNFTCTSFAIALAKSN